VRGNQQLAFFAQTEERDTRFGGRHKPLYSGDAALCDGPSEDGSHWWRRLDRQMTVAAGSKIRE